MRDEISLAKTEISEKIGASPATSAYLAAGAFVAYAGLLLILQGFSFLLGGLFLSWGLSEASAALLGFLIVGAVVGAIGAYPRHQGPGHAEKRTSYSNENR